MTRSDGISLAEGMRRTQLSYEDLWVRCFALGGPSDSGHLRDHVEEQVCPDENEYKIIAQALNDAFLDLGGDHPVAYNHVAAEPE
ncbi:MAG: hypothetical protein INR66_25800 [Gordonia polyisoprenivorans]|nr:hypothetical protein [Gordonia polyisoprenivorans]